MSRDHPQRRSEPMISIRPFVAQDTAEVRDLFIRVNRLLAPPDLHDQFEAYIDRALNEEIDRIEAYYEERDGGFWMAVMGEGVLVRSVWNVYRRTHLS